MNEVDLDRLRFKLNRIQQLSMLTEVLRTLITSMKLDESEIAAGLQHHATQQPIPLPPHETPALLQPFGD